MLLLLVLAPLFFLACSSTQPPSPTISLAHGLKTPLAPNLLEELQPALSHPISRPWALVVAARHLQNGGDEERARQFFAQVPPQSAASLDAEVGLLQLSPRSERFLEDYRVLEKKLRRAQRRDLLPELKIARIYHAEGNSQFELAYDLTQEFLKEYPNARLQAKVEASRARLKSRSPDLEKREVPTPSVIDEALSRVKKLWNANRHAEALLLLQELTRSAAGTPRFAELLLLRAQIHDEANSPEKAEEDYRLAIPRLTTDQLRRSARRNLAWFYYRHKQVGKAAEQFLLASSIPSQQGKAYDKLYQQLRYWGAVSLNLAKEKGTTIAKPWRLVSPQIILEELVTTAPYSYYGQRAAEYLGRAANAFVPTAASCPAPDLVPSELQQRLDFFGAVELAIFSRHEINFALAEELLPENAVNRLPTELTRARLLSAYGSVQESIGVAEQLRRVLAQISAEAVNQCLPQLIALSYPLAHGEEFLRVASEESLNPALLFAIARSESRFNPQALSPKNAMGLLQLLPSTAKDLGLSQERELYHAPTNIALGGRYLAQLLAEYQGDKVRAIAAYNAGPPAVKRWSERYRDLPQQAWIEMIGYGETREYVKEVLASEGVYEGMLRGRR